MTLRGSVMIAGGEALLMQLDILDRATRGPFLERVAVAGAQPILGAMKRGAAYKTGNLYRGIMIGGHNGLQQPTTGTDIGGAVAFADFALVRIGTNVAYGRRRELGFIGTDSLGRNYHDVGTPYVLPAFMSNKEDAMRVMANMVGAQFRLVSAVRVA